MWYPPKERTEQLDATLASLETHSVDCGEDVEAFLVRISACIRHLAVNELVPPSYLRDWIWIGSQFRINAGNDTRVKFLARRALLFLFERLDSQADKNTEFREDINWVTDSTVSELTAELGPNSYNSFLSPAELRHVESRLQDLRSEAPDFSVDEEANLQMYLSYFRDVASETYLPSISNMVSRIHEKLNSSGKDREAALACLRYVVEEEDVVKDTLGYLGLVDDIYAVELTYREIGNLSAWGPLLGKFSSRWPYLTRVAFEEDSGTIRFSSYMQAIFGTAIYGLTKEGSRACLVLPEARICGLLGAFLACVESIRNQTSCETEHREFAVGEYILFGDADRTIKVKYAGMVEFEGIKYQSVLLRGGGKAMVPDSIMAIAQRSAKSYRNLSNAKEFSEWKKKYSLTPLTHLVGRDVRFDDLRPEVLLVTRRNRLDDLLQKIKPMGRTIPELVGMKYIASTGTEENLPGSVVRDPLIWSCSDANTARELISSTDGSFNPRYVIIDEADLAAELEDSLHSDDVPASSSHIIIVPLHETEVIRRLQNQNFDTWLLKQSDVEHISDTDLETLTDNAGIISRYQRRQELKAHVTSKIHDIQCEPVEFLYEYLRDIRGASQATDDTQHEVVALAASAFVRRFIRLPLHFDEIESEELKGLLANLLSHCGILADYNRDIHDLAEYVQSMIETGIPENPRQATIEKLIAKNGAESIAVVCPSMPVADAATRRTSDHEVLGKAKWISMNQLRQIAPLEQIIIPGWLDRRAMRELRNTGYANHVDLVLYGFEREWETTSRKAAQSWEKRLASRMRSQWDSLKKTFPDLTEPTFLEEERDEVGSDQLVEPAEPETDLLQVRFIDTIRRQTSVPQVGVHMAKARLVIFEEPGIYIYLPPYGNVISLSRALDAGVDHLPEDDGEEGEGEESMGRRAERLISCPVGEIAAGDLLAFPTDSTSDLLGSLANRFIPEPEKTRRLADLWRTALRSYLKTTQKSIKVLRNELEVGGLKRHPFTIKMWVEGMDIVAPMNYADAITVIAEVTSHEELGSCADEVRSAIDLVYRVRGKAAGEILKQLARRDIELNEGTASVRIAGHEIQYRLQRVLTIDPPTEVSQDAIGVLSNITDFSQ